uniref:Apple domain-containing protein n=1 Tax=Angiostrongylus cantonensis TaxID=6313 RepID=A0A158P5X6_ANGCA
MKLWPLLIIRLQVDRDSAEQRQVVAGIPDTNDPCYRRYANCIIVNAQPYERRSSISLVRCKSHCLNSQTGVYSCRSFIYDNINQVCDLFSHVGDQPPARLLKFQTRDYFEPTHVVQCLNFLRTEGFELYKNDDITMQVSDVSECISACERNHVSWVAYYFLSSLLTSDPLLNVQLATRCSTSFFQPIRCTSSTKCSSSFPRFPQMILVGFAETVIDASSFETCFEHCFDSQKMFGFRCASGMYFFEESQLNCILNSEDRHTQKDLFTEENTDIVDYFEIGCDEPRVQKRLHASTIFGKSSVDIQYPLLCTQTKWSKCADGMQHRRRDCDSRVYCGMESRPCNEGKESIKMQNQTHLDLDDLPWPEDIARVKANVVANGLRCPQDVCCTVFKRSSVGLRFNTKTKRLEWCEKPSISPSSEPRTRLTL